MYSVVLLLAVTSGSEGADFGFLRKGGCGGCGGVVTHGGCLLGGRSHGHGTVIVTSGCGGYAAPAPVPVPAPAPVNVPVNRPVYAPPPGYAPPGYAPGNRPVYAPPMNRPTYAPPMNRPVYAPSPAPGFSNGSGFTPSAVPPVPNGGGVYTGGGVAPGFSNGSGIKPSEVPTIPETPGVVVPETPITPSESPAVVIPSESTPSVVIPSESTPSIVYPSTPSVVIPSGSCTGGTLGGTVIYSSGGTIYHGGVIISGSSSGVIVSGGCCGGSSSTGTTGTTGGTGDAKKELTLKVPGNVTVAAGASAPVTIGVERKGFEDEVTLEVTALPEGVTVADPKTLVVAKGAKEAKISLKADAKAKPGAYTAKVAGKGVGGTTDLKITVAKAGTTDDDEEVTEKPARLEVKLPADATLTIDGKATKSVTALRSFETPALEINKVFSYTLEAKYTKDGEVVTVKKVVDVEAGATTKVDLNKGEAVVVNK